MYHFSLRGNRGTRNNSTNAGIVSDALNFVNQSKEKINTNTMRSQTAEETETKEAPLHVVFTD
jgi:hypothetical protein